MRTASRLVIPAPSDDLPDKSLTELSNEARQLMIRFLQLTFGAVTGERKYDLSPNEDKHPRELELLMAWRLQDMLNELIHRAGGPK